MTLSMFQGRFVWVYIVCILPLPLQFPLSYYLYSTLLCYLYLYSSLILPLQSPFILTLPLQFPFILPVLCSSLYLTFLSWQSLRHSYEQTQSELAEWLDKKPNTDPLKQVRQNIKTLKSKLRHKLADKQDADEVSNRGGCTGQIYIYIFSFWLLCSWLPKPIYKSSFKTSRVIH